MYLVGIYGSNMARNQIKVVSPTSHGGIIISGSGNSITEGTPLSRIFDVHICPFHGPNFIASGSGDTFTNGLPNARLGDVCACGAVILPGAASRFTN